MVSFRVFTTLLIPLFKPLFKGTVEELRDLKATLENTMVVTSPREMGSGRGGGDVVTTTQPSAELGVSFHLETMVRTSPASCDSQNQQSFLTPLLPYKTHFRRRADTFVFLKFAIMKCNTCKIRIFCISILKERCFTKIYFKKK